MRAEQERKHDKYEEMSHAAMMQRQAHHAKKLTHADLYKRPSGTTTNDKSRLEALKDKTRIANDWLANLTAGGGVGRKE